MWVTISDDTWAYYTLGIIMLWAISVFSYINNQLISSGSFVSTMLAVTFFTVVYGGGFLILLVLL